MPEQNPVSPAPSTMTDAETTPSTDDMQASGGLYQVVDGNKLDEFSYEGFKLYRNWCARCHGTYGQGMVGPNLAESLNVISKEQFVEVVTHGKTGQIGSMPAWESNEAVMNGMDNLYAYLKARADGAIGEVKPTKQQ
ncbi:cytochrome c [Methylophaga sp.]|uniref:c-type cytochrome n=1 Tax=Methylophaga sp. TaxID=2024840 RepID=UPI003453B63A